MVAIAEKLTDVGKLVNALIELGLDAVETYETAIDRVDDIDDRERFEAMRAAHARQVVALQSLVSEHGDTPANSPDLRRMIDKGKVVIASLMGDRLVLFAMKNIEANLVDAYESALEHPMLPPDIRESLVRFRNEGRSHVAALEERLVSFDEVEVESYVPPNVDLPPPSRDEAPSGR